MLQQLCVCKELRVSGRWMLVEQDVKIVPGGGEWGLGNRVGPCSCNLRTCFDGLVFTFVWKALLPLVLRKISVCAASPCGVMLRGEVTRAKPVPGPAVPAGSSCPSSHFHSDAESSQTELGMQ